MIGIFDSGVGGLGVLSHLRSLLPDVDLLYVADQARAPYGVRPLREVADISFEVADWLIAAGASTVVIACNTASAAALHPLRARHPEVAFVGMEPAVKPAATTTASGVIGVLATAATFQGELFASVVQSHAGDNLVLTSACPELVELVEAGVLTGPEARAAVERCVRPLLGGGADTLVLGCTHFPFLEATIAEVAGPSISIIDPAPAVAAQAARVHNGPSGSGRLTLATSGDPVRFAEQAFLLARLEADPTVLAFPADVPAH